MTKASVSITFNNSDRERSPVGYEHCEQITVTRQIVIGGRNKYLINGQVAQPTRVQNLFHSVQLNVNNPHFLIMQGRITKVLNMKPPEILSMLEEAAGTRMYENKKETALKTLDKKQAKVDEIDKLLEEEILPTIEKLRKERGDYMKWAAGNDTLERLRRFCVAYEFTRATRAVEDRGEGEAEVRAAIDELDARAVDREDESRRMDENLARVAAEKEAQTGGDAAKLSAEVDALSKELVKDTAAWTHKKDAVKSEKKSGDKLRKQAQKHEEDAAKEEDRLSALETKHAEKTSAMADAEKAAETAEMTLQGVQSGTAPAAREQVAADAARRRRRRRRAGGRRRQGGRAQDQTRREGTHRRQKAHAAKEKAGAKLTKELEIAEAREAEARERLAAHPGADAAAVAALEVTADAADAALRQAQEKVDVLEGQLAGLDFKFKDPEAKFDRSRVKGVVAKLLRVADPAASTALEVVAGGKLYQVVVDTEVTGKALLAKGQLQKRVTIIPLNKIDARVATESQIARASQLSGGDAKLAVSLVTSDDEVQNVMAYVFGKAFVCKDAATARRVAFDKGVLTNCVTVEGDLLNPSGLLTGGSRGGGGSVLAKLHALHAAEEALERAKAEADDAANAMRAAAKEAKAAAALETALDNATHALGLVREKLAGSESHQLAEAVRRLEEEATDATSAAAAAKTAKTTAAEKAEALEREIRSFAEERESRLKEAEKALKEAREAVSKRRADIKAAETEMRDAKVERESAAAERAALAESIAAADAAVAELEAEAATLEEAMASRREAYDDAASRLDAKKRAAAECDREAASIVKAKQRLERAAEADAVERKKLEHKATRMEKEAAESREHLARLAEEHPWIDSERSRFGAAGGDYDFAARDPSAAAAELAAAEETQASLGKRVNKKVIAMFDKAEAEFKALQEKRRIVLNDRSKIESVIRELDEKKKEALRVTWTKVNADFGSIFSTLLPSTSAKLEPPEGESFLAGLEVKVAFGGVWKESLTELSGGQRSLLALSLILALLLFKPAPIYILDEVDAALDLSHTQNIGRMIRAHFPYSQFIVVSLKEGMFNNANCIFRTKFVDGVSTVTRTVPALKAADPNADKEKGPGVSEAAQKRRRQGKANSKENVA